MIRIQLGYNQDIIKIQLRYKPDIIRKQLRYKQDIIRSISMMQMSLYATKEAAKEYEKFESDTNIFCILILISFYIVFSLQTLLFWCKCRPISVIAGVWHYRMINDQCWLCSGCFFVVENTVSLFLMINV